ncbi:MAG: AzlC family ABC transporter permease [Bacillota bacterium]|nr:AzlC family ABC transporter permease [Bacillota bacterium]
MKTKSVSSSAFNQGLGLGLPIGLGYFAVALAFGLSAVGAGFTPLVATLISLTNLSGAGQFAGVQVVGAGGSWIELISTVLIINLRYILMSLALQQKLPARLSLWQRIVIGYGVTDEIFAVAIAPSSVISWRWFLGLLTLPVLGWTGGTTVGAVLGEILPANIVAALGIALYCMFIAIVIPPALDSRPVLNTVLIATAASCLLKALPVTSSLPFGWRVIVATLLAAGYATWRWPNTPEVSTAEDAENAENAADDAAADAAAAAATTGKEQSP